jgi:hypothetical protein
MELDLEELLHVIFGLLLVVGSDGTVNLVHQSAKDFLFDISSGGQDNLGPKNFILRPFFPFLSLEAGCKYCAFIRLHVIPVL